MKVLVDRVERSTNAQGNAFSLFQAAITLDSTIRLRTSELRALNAQLQQEIAERSAVEAALERAKRDAERANVGKTEFLRAASHDLLQPLSIARLILGTLRARDHDGESVAMLAQVERSLEDAESLLSTLLEMSRIDAGALVPEIVDVAIDPLLKHLSDDYALQTEERQLRLRVIPCSAHVRTDIRILERILRNLVSNALRYTDRGGILVGCRMRGERLRIEVWDTGIGMPPDRLADIFKEFVRLDDAGDRPSGSGLGLAIVARLARLLGYAVSVRSREGRGSVFAIELPMGDASRVRARDNATSLLAEKTVLLIDGDLSTSADVARQLRGWGLAVLEAQSFAAALAITKAHGFAPSVVVLGDRALSEMHGIDIVERLRERFDQFIPAVILSADEDVARRPSGSGYWYLHKPIRIERLRSLLNHLLTLHAEAPV